MACGTSVSAPAQRSGVQQRLRNCEIAPAFGALVYWPGRPKDEIAHEHRTSAAGAAEDEQHCETMAEQKDLANRAAGLAEVIHQESEPERKTHEHQQNPSDKQPAFAIGRHGPFLPEITFIAQLLRPMRSSTAAGRRT